MRKNSTTVILERWKAMDRALADPDLGEGLHPATFARAKKVSVKTVLRDLEAFKKMKLAMEEIIQEGVKGVAWRYKKNVGPLFVITAKEIAAIEKSQAVSRERQERLDVVRRDRAKSELFGESPQG